MLVQTYDMLASGRRIRSIRFGPPRGGHINFGGAGMRVAHADDENEDGTAAAWVCVSEEGIWLSYNAHVIGPDGPNGGGMQGQEDPLSSIEEIVFA